LKDLYTDYLISSTGLTTATGFSRLVDNEISHDKVTRFLSTSDFSSKDLWEAVKPMVKEQAKEGVKTFLIFDDSIKEKYYTDESELISWHHDHVFNRAVKGVNFLTALVNIGDVNLPCAVEFIKKDKWEKNEKTGKQKRASSKTKNELLREMVTQCKKNFKFDYVLTDSWYCCKENMKLIKGDLNIDFVMAMPVNRNVALSKADKDKKKYVGIESLQLGQQTVEVWVEGLDFPLLLLKQIFKNEDDTVGELYLVSSDLNLSYDEITTIYKKRWAIEVYHKSTKSNASFAKSPTKTIKTQTNHFMLSILAYVKLEGLKVKRKLNHFAIKAKIYEAALKAAY
ncbi:transposase, partial [Parasediminibacterium sp. JCM 36343]|uniref:IS701 family transposase n=1 Tax=Parasediminibacterium sp. JCM 36343 TaxID=3374279 RepID=UPI00397BF8AF